MPPESDPHTQLLVIPRGTDGSLPLSRNIDTAKNRLRGSSGLAPDIGYDAAGNMIAVGLHTNGSVVREFSYDALNMQATYRRRAADGSLKEDFLYLYGPGNYRLFVWDGINLRRHFTFRDSGGKILREYQVTGFGPAAVWSYQKDFLHGPSGLVATRNAFGANRYFHHDHLGTPRLITGNSATPVVHNHYYPYGAQANSFNPTDEHRYKYTGHERDRNGEFTTQPGATDYMLGRTYAYPFERFMQVDPARDGWNLYGYVGGNPVRFTDPTGLITGAQIADTADASINELKTNLVDSASDGSGFGIFKATVGGALLDGAKLFTDLLRLGQSSGQAYADPDVDGLEAGLLVLEDVGRLATIAGTSGSVLKSTSRGVRLTRGGVGPVRLGQAGEDAVRAFVDIGAKVPIRVAGRTRIPDGLTKTTLSEVKNVQSLSFTQQLRDFVTFSQQNSLQFDLYVRETTRLSGPLKQAVSDGLINLRFIP